MEKETKSMLYMFLDLIDSLLKTSKDNPNFIKIDEVMITELKSKIFSIMSNEQSAEKNVKKEILYDLLQILMDKKQFPLNSDITKFANEILKNNLKSNGKSRTNLIGEIVTQISNMNDEEITIFYKKWEKFIQIRKYDKNQDNIKKKGGFVDAWVNFYRNYKG